MLCDGLEGAFERFAGVPEKFLFGQMESVVVSEDCLAGGGLVLNAEFLRFAAHWDFRPRSRRPTGADEVQGGAAAGAFRAGRARGATGCEGGWPIPP